MKKLGRNLGLWGVVAVSVGAMIGGGLFVLPGLAAAITGPTVWIAYLVAALLVLPAALSKAELATGMPGAGGSYVFVERSLGPFAGAVAGVGASLSLMLKGCFALIGLTWYLALLVPVSPSGSPAQLARAALVLLALLAVVNALGVAKVGRIQVVLVLASVSLLAVIDVMGLAAVDGDNLRPAFPMGSSGLLYASAFVFVSYAGVTKIAAIAEEVKNPARNIPLGMLLSLGLVAVLYATTTFVMLGVVPWQELSGDITPLATVATRVRGPVLGALAAVVASLALTSVANASILTASRFPFAMARDGLLPGAVARVHPASLTPVNAIALTAATMAAMILLLDVEKVVKLASGFQIFIFAVENFAVIVFRESGARWYRPTFRSPLYPWMQIAGIVGGVVLLAALGPLAIGGVALFSALAAAGYAYYGRRHAKRTGLLQQLLSDGAAAPVAGVPEPPDRPLPEARVVVALLGNERSPETLLEVADGMRSSPSDRIDVLLVKDVPEQTVLAAVPSGDRTASFRRRIGARARELGVPVWFEEVVTHDLRGALYQEAVEASCEWLLLPYRRRRQARFVRSPLERLMTRLPCDVAVFRDAGIRAYRRILVLAEPGPHDALVVRTANGLARRFDATLTFVDAVPPDAAPERVRAVTDYHEQLRALCTVESASELLRASDRVSAIAHASVDYDLLVLAAGDERPLRHIFVLSDHHLLTARAVCSVLQLRTPPERTHEKVEQLDRAAAEADLVAFLAPKALRPCLDVRTKKALFAELAAAFAGQLDLPSGEVEEAFWSRERMQNTAMGGAVAIPHATLPAAPRTLVGLFTLSEPVDYLQGGGQSVDVCFATVGPPAERPAHLRLLARISRLVLDTALLEDARAATTPGALREAIERAQEELDRR